MSNKRNRRYKRGEPFRDASLFVVACEGAKREKVYFEKLVGRNRRVKIKVLSPEPMLDGNNHSSPKAVLDRAAKFQEEFGLAQDDELWLVFDRDRWKENQIRDCIAFCAKTPQWSIAISNPCFEVWLIYHSKSQLDLPVGSPQKLKRELAQCFQGGYEPQRSLELVDQAISHAKAQDPDPLHPFPAPGTTKVYQLVERLLQFISLP